MAGFGFTEEQEMFRETVQRFARQELAPGAKERAKKTDRPLELIKKVADQGLVGLAVPEEFGGGGQIGLPSASLLRRCRRLILGLACCLYCPACFPSSSPVTVRRRCGVCDKFMGNNFTPPPDVPKNLPSDCSECCSAGL